VGTAETKGKKENIGKGKKEGRDKRLEEMKE
jgi:hypothetical protein